MDPRFSAALSPPRLAAARWIVVLALAGTVSAGCAEDELDELDADADVAAETGTMPSDADSGETGPRDATDSSDGEGIPDGTADSGSDADAASCGGRCGADQICDSGSCVDPCNRQGASCGTVTVGGESFACGTCAGDQYCSKSRKCRPICKKSGAECGTVFWGGVQTDCGSCSGARSCFHNRCVASGYRSIDGGNHHTCATDDQGTLYCWGADLSEQLGNGSGSASKTPVEATASGTALEVRSLRLHTCAQLNSGSVRCWGSNNKGQVGSGSSAVTVDSPVLVSGLGRGVDVGVGHQHSCAALVGGGVECWGAQTFGRLGNGSNSLGEQPTPVSVKNLQSAIEVVAGGSHTCALKSDGTVVCWGNGSAGRLGNGGFSEESTPVEVDDLDGVVDLGAGVKHTCAVTRDGDVWCWGFGGDAQLGQGSESNASVPVRVQNIEDAVAVAAGLGHTCIRNASGAVFCWGANVERNSSGTIVSGGQLGDGTFQDSKTPVQVVGPGGSGKLTGVVALGAGRRHTCAVTRDGDAYCWGTNDEGRLGDGSTTNRNYPKEVQ